MTASAANAGGLVTRHQSSLQHTVDPTRTITSRTANSYSISGSGVSLDLDADTTGNDLIVGGFNEFSNGAVSSWHIPTATITDGEAFSFPIVLLLVMPLMQLEQKHCIYSRCCWHLQWRCQTGTIDSGHGISVSGTTQGAGTSVTAQFVSEISIFD